ncbi:MAG TPA: dienelactone hydrolase family protein [Ktedonobacterales bacterium]
MSDARSPETPLSPTAAETVRFPLRGQPRAAYYARPDSAGPFPGVVVIHEAFGLNQNIRDVTRRFAGAGYAALAVDLFAGRNPAVCMARFIGQMLSGSTDNSSIDEFKAALDWLGARPEVSGSRLGAVGFCMGGTFAIAWACSDQRLQVIAPFYARNPRPLEATRRMCPVVGSYPDRDFTTEPGRKLDAELTTASIPHDIKIYPNTKHSFFNDRGATHDPAASADAWQRIMTYFSERLGTAG